MNFFLSSSWAFIATLVTSTALDVTYNKQNHEQRFVVIFEWYSLYLLAIQIILKFAFDSSYEPRQVGINIKSYLNIFVIEINKLINSPSTISLIIWKTRVGKTWFTLGLIQ